jgi:hypothetical protein
MPISLVPMSKYTSTPVYQRLSASTPISLVPSAYQPVYKDAYERVYEHAYVPSPRR